MMKIITGWIFILFSLVTFSFFLIEVTAEVQDIQTLSEKINEKVDFTSIKLPTNSTIYDRNGNIISEVYRNENRIYLSYDSIPTQVINAFIATEDQRFFEHKGYDAIAIARALLANIRHQGIEEGGSTMTQQLVRNLFLTHEQTYNRKMTEILYAHELEKSYSKQEIIELYLNSIYFNNGVYGIEAASRYYFNKSTDQLSLAETAFLSAVPNNPSHYDPIEHSDRTKLRQEWILKQMLEGSYLSNEAYEQALQETIILNVHKRIDEFPDYTTYIHQELSELVSHSEGFTLKIEQAATPEEKELIEQQLQVRVQSLLQSGIQIDTALDPYMQNLATKSIQRHVPETDIQASTAVIDNTVNELVAITGGKGYNKFDFHRGFQDFRQPGSAIKPLLVYGPYLEESNAQIQSSVDASNFCKGEYCPKNYGNKQYGTVSLETALKHSYNTPAVRLLDQIGVQTGFSYIEKFSFSKLVADDYVLGSALGGFSYGMSPLEMTRAYTTFAHEGTYTPAYGIRQVKDKDGVILYSWEPKSEQIWSSSTNNKMRNLLSSVISSGTAQKARVNASYQGGKTGTTNDFTNLWFVGLTDQYTAGVWIGKDDQQSVEKVNQKSPQLLIWKDLME